MWYFISDNNKIYRKEQRDEDAKELSNYAIDLEIFREIDNRLEMIKDFDKGLK